MVFGAVIFKLLVWCVAEGYVSGLQDAGLPASWLDEGAQDKEAFIHTFQT